LPWRARTSYCRTGRWPIPQLPAQTTPFIGREQQLTLLRERLLCSDVRLLTLTGAGGSGKTRLALQVAAGAHSRFDNGVCFVSLASVADPNHVVPTIARAIGFQERAGQAPLDTLRDYLSQQHLLLVLDNFEHVAEAAPLVADLLAGCPRLKALVTSRAVLHLYGEYDFPLPPLSLPDDQTLGSAQHVGQAEAVQLFVVRAQAARPDFALTDENAPVVAEICRRLDGLPLAIELAAARIRALPPEALLARMERTLPLLTGGPRDVPARQQTLRNTIAWSYDLLTLPEQTLFRRLAVFRGCTLDAAEVVCGANGAAAKQAGSSSITLLPLETEVLDGIVSLIDKSLLRREGAAGDQPWYVMLETVREFALERLEESGEDEVIGRRHVLHYLRLVEKADAESDSGARQHAWFTRLEQEHENLRAALDRCEAHGYAIPALRIATALTWFWEVRGHVREGRERFARLLSCFPARGATGERAALRARALHAAATLAVFQGDHIGARALQEEGLHVLEEQDDTPGVYSALTALGLIANLQQDYEAAQEFVERAMDVAHLLDDADAVEGARVNLSHVLHEAGDLPRAREELERSIRFWRETGDRQGLAYGLRLLATIAEAQRDYTSYRAFAKEELALNRQMGDRRREALTLASDANLATDQGDYDTAHRLFVESLTLLQELGDVASSAFVIERVAVLAAAQRQDDRATRLAGAAAALRQHSGVPLTPRAEEQLQSALAPARQALGETAFTKVWESGQALTLGEAIACARRETDQEPETDRIEAGAVSPSTVLSPRELEVAVLIAQGYTNRKIAEELVITGGTAANHVAHILSKLGFNSRNQIVAWVFEHRLAKTRR
jgi:predicted ATPase/DNA-binding NarL/FixJ family response regulator